MNHPQASNHTGVGVGSDLRFSVCDISSDYVQVVDGRFERLFCVMARNKSGVIIKGRIALPAETVKDDQQTSMFLIDARSHKIDDRDVVARLASRTESMAEHEPEGSLEHCFVGLLKASLLVKKREFGGPKQASYPRSRGSDRFAPSQPRVALPSSLGPMSKTRLLCQTFSKKASFRARREPSSFGVRTV